MSPSGEKTMITCADNSIFCMKKTEKMNTCTSNTSKKALLKRWILVSIVLALIGWYFGVQHLTIVGSVFVSFPFSHSSDPVPTGFTIVPTRSSINSNQERILTFTDALSSVSRECVSAVKRPFVEEPFFDVFSLMDKFCKYVGWECTKQRHVEYDLNDMSICDQGNSEDKYTYSFELPLIGKIIITVEDSTTTSFLVNHDTPFSITNDDGTEVKEFIYDMKWSQPSMISLGGIKCDSVVLFSIFSPLYKGLAVMNTSIRDMCISCRLQPSLGITNLLSGFSVKLGQMDYTLSARNVIEKHILNALTWYHMDNLRSSIESYIQGKISDAWIGTALNVTKSINDKLEYSKSLIYSIFPSFTKNN